MILQIPKQVREEIRKYFVSNPLAQNYEVTFYTINKVSYNKIVIKKMYLPTQIGTVDTNYLIPKSYVGYLHYHSTAFPDLSPTDEIFAYNKDTHFFLVFTREFNIRKIVYHPGEIKKTEIVNTALEEIKPVQQIDLYQEGFIETFENIWTKYYFNQPICRISQNFDYVEIPYWIELFKKEKEGVLILSRFDLLTFPISVHQFQKIIENNLHKWLPLKNLQINHHQDYIYIVKSD